MMSSDDNKEIARHYQKIYIGNNLNTLGKAVKERKIQRSKHG